MGTSNAPETFGTPVFVTYWSVLKLLKWCAKTENIDCNVFKAMRYRVDSKRFSIETFTQLIKSI